MKYINKIYTLALMAALAFGFSACTESEDYTPAQKVAGMEVYFNGVNSVTTKNLSSKENSFSIPVSRVKTADAANVAVTVQIPEGSKISCSAPSVSFAAGAKDGSLNFSYNPEEMEFDHFDTIKVAIKDVDATSPYGVSEFTLIAGIPAPWVSVGQGKLVEDYFWGFEVKMDIYQNQVEPSLYRIENVFVPDGANASPWLYFKVLKKGDVVLEQTVPEDDMVYFYGDGSHYEFNTGYLNTTYNANVCLVFPGVFNSLSDPSNWMQNKVLAYQEDGTVGAIQLAPEYYMFGIGGWGGSESDGDIIITFPGFEMSDYSAEIDVVGRLIDTKENGQAVVNVTLGEDVASAKAAMAAGKDPMVAYEMIQNGDESVQEITESSELRFPYDESGDYTVVVVTYDEEGNEQGSFSALVKIPEGGGKETYSALFKGIYTHCVKSYSEEGGPMWEDYDPEEAILYECDQNENKLMISPWVNLGYEDNGTEGEGLVFTIDEENNIIVEPCYTGVTDSRYGDIFAWDLTTAGLTDQLPSYFDEESGTFVFNLAWSVEAGDFGFTMDTYLLTGYAEAPRKAKAASPISVKNMKRSLPLKKAAAMHKSFKPVSKKFVTFKK